MYTIDLTDPMDFDRYACTSTEEEIAAVIQSVSKQMNKNNERELINQALDKVQRDSRELLKYRLIGAAGSDELVKESTGFPWTFLMIDSLRDDQDRLKHVLDLMDGKKACVLIIMVTQLIGAQRVKELLQIIREHHQIDFNELRSYIEVKKPGALKYLDNLYPADV